MCELEKMSACGDKFRKPYDYRISDYENFMLNYRYTLTNALESEQAIPWLMENGVLDKSDQEMILYGHTTSVLKAGDMIDTVLKKGPRGFNALLEFIEYEYVEIYQKMMNKPARQPDKSVYKPRRSRSQRVSMACWEAVSKFLSAMESSKKNTSRMEEEEKVLRLRIDEIQNELEMRDQQISEQIQKVLDVEIHNKELLEQLQQTKKDRAETDEQIKILRQERDAALDEIRSEKKKHINQVIQDIRKTSIKEKKGTQPPGDLLRHQPTRQQSFDEEIKRHKEIITELQEKNVELAFDKASLNDQFDRLAEEFDSHEDSSKQYTDQVRRLQQERDAILKQHEDLKQKYELLQQNSNYLKENIIKNNSELRILKNEAKSCRPRLRVVSERDELQRRIDKDHRPTVPWHEREQILTKNFLPFHDSAPLLDDDDDDDGAPSQTQAVLQSTAGTQHNNPCNEPTGQLELKKNESAVLRHRSCDQSRVVREVPARSQKDLVVSSAAVATGSYVRTPPSPADKSVLREPLLCGNSRHLHSTTCPDTGPFQRNVKNLSGKKKYPLVLYAAEPLHHELQQHLLERYSDSFAACPYERLPDERHKMLPEWLEAGRIIHYAKQGDGVYQCLGTDALRQHMKMEDCGRVLLDLPVEAIHRMHMQKITTYVLIVKYEDLDNRGLKSEEELEMEKMHPDHRSSYEKLVIDQSTNFDTIACKIINKIAIWDSKNNQDTLSDNCNAAAPPCKSSHA